MMGNEHLTAPSIQDDFRACFQRHMTTVTIVTSQFGGLRAGLAATAVCSLSDSPPSMLISINHNARACELIRASGAFSVNMLADSQLDVATVFSRSAKSADEAEQKFINGGAWEEQDGLPWLSGALANVSCRVLKEVPVASHSVFIGEVQGIRLLSNGNPLLYGFREFHGKGLPLQRAVSASVAR
ncbi:MULTISPECIES: flavin reductase family protein [unclassified Caballeronia]|uniref:flavin reductase family protein n=1 Tax=unclassified Caballeronia TaxID=2646786 RepID=UPI002858B85B|nr:MULTISPECIES: flavin reductase family protein [unclassified Caballeronia]MDR5815215.1 flavin reductase family protein [Caballeronia sp. LZ033]MDR5822642.1 flavin reductase family protein [Caballeronia sp. LZ043]MDR5879953.1 flavin reductase family protein [Caballeronia sp. LZ032]